VQCEYWKYFGVDPSDMGSNFTSEGLWILVFGMVLFLLFAQNCNLWLHYEAYTIKQSA
jgi:hypothetical protein